MNLDENEFFPWFFLHQYYVTKKFWVTGKIKNVTLLLALDENTFPLTQEDNFFFQKI